MGRVYGIDVLNALVKMKSTMKEPVLSYDIIDRHRARMAVHDEKLANIQEARVFEMTKVKKQIASDNGHEAQLRFMFLKTECKEHRRLMRTPQPILMSDTERIKFSQEWFHYSSRKEEFKKNKIKVFYLILGQCSERLIKRMKKYREWGLVNESINLYDLCRLIESSIYWEHQDTCAAKNQQMSEAGSP